MVRSRTPRDDERSARRVSALAALVACGAALSACGTPTGALSPEEGARPPIAQSAPTADEYMEARDYDRAADLYTRDLARTPGDAELQEKSRTARRLAAQEHADAAGAAAARNDLVLAARELELAERYDSNAEPVRRVREALRARLTVRRDVEARKITARALIATDPAAAVNELAELRRAAPYDPEIVEMLTTATRRAGADAAAQRAEEAWAAGARRRAIEHLDVAVMGGAPVPRATALRRRIETDLLAESADAPLARLRADLQLARDAKLSVSTCDHLRDRLIDALQREVRRHEDAGHPATAALFEIEAQRAGGRTDARNADQIRAEHGIVLHVAPFDDGTGGSVDGLRLARAVRDHLVLQSAGGSAALTATTDPAPSTGYPHLRVEGTASSQRITAGRVGRELQTVRFVAGTHDTANPAAVRLDAELTGARNRLARARELQMSAETRLRELEALGYGRGAGGTVGTEGDIALQSRIASARTAVENTKRAATVAERAEFDIRQHILQTPSTVAESVWEERPVEVTTLIKTAEIVADVRVMDGTQTLFDQKVTGSDVHRETVSPGIPEGGIAADPDETPNDAVMAARAADRLADAVAGKIRATAESAARRLLEEARASERGGDSAAAAETYAVYLLTTSETATPERAAAARALYEILGSAPVLRTGFEPEVPR